MQKIVIIGAGLVGSLWAVFMARRGYQVEVYERRPDLRQRGYMGGRSINLAMSERGWEAIRKAGLTEPIGKVAIPMPGRMIHSVAGELTFQPYGKEGQAIYSVSRGGLNLELLRLADAYPNVQIHFEHRCADVDLQEPRITLEDLTTGTHKTIDAPLIFGTDGAFSAVRYALQRTDRFDYTQRYLAHGYKELTIPPAADGGYRMDPAALHIWPRGNFMMIALPNADRSFTCTLFLPFEGPDSFEHLTDVAVVRAFFERYFADTLPLIPDLETDFFRNQTSSLVTVQCAPWQWQNRMLLLGDSAHAIVPFYGQGMNAGFEDCTILDALLDECAGDWSRTISTFATRRKPDGDAIAELALRNFVEMRDSVGQPQFLLRKKIMAYFQERYPQFLPSYSLVTFTNTPYHQALAEDDRQNAYFNALVARPDIEHKWQSAEVEADFVAWMGR
jgi:kynurenine 3-monooxygenase